MNPLETLAGRGWLQFAEITALTFRTISQERQFALDETCWFLAVDLDKESWQLDPSAHENTEIPVVVTPPVLRTASGIRIFYERRQNYAE